MRRVIHKVFWAWEFEKEEKWLNEMSTKGLQLIDVGYCRYTFEEGTPGEYLYRIELLENSPQHAESISYIHFLEDIGVEHIGSLFRWVYFRKKAADGDFDLFSDIDSRIKHLNRILSFFLSILLLNLFAMSYNFCFYIFNDTKVNLICSFISLTLSLFLVSGIINFGKRISRFKKERFLRE